MSINCWNRNECKYTFLNAKNCTSAAERQESAREFCMALWYHEYPERADNDMINIIMPYLASCARVCNDEHDFELIARGMRNIYWGGVDKGREEGFKEGYYMGFNVAEDEERG